jgi:hypothetical protein
MSDREQHTTGPAPRGAGKKQARSRQEKDGGKWTLILVRELRHSPEKVWQALTDPAHLLEWAPFTVDTASVRLGTVKLTWWEHRSNKRNATPSSLGLRRPAGRLRRLRSRES